MSVIDSVKNNELIIKMVKFFEIEIKQVSDLVGIELERDILITDAAVIFLKSLQDEIKNCGYKSGVLTSLFKNNVTNQRWPALNTMRQILKCNGLKMQPVAKSNGYNKSNGKKNILRSFIIIKFPKVDIDSTNTDSTNTDTDTNDTNTDSTNTNTDTNDTNTDSTNTDTNDTNTDSTNTDNDNTKN